MITSTDLLTIDYILTCSKSGLEGIRLRQAHVAVERRKAAEKAIADAARAEALCLFAELVDQFKSKLASE